MSAQQTDLFLAQVMETSEIRMNANLVLRWGDAIRDTYFPDKFLENSRWRHADVSSTGTLR